MITVFQCTSLSTVVKMGLKKVKQKVEKVSCGD